MNAAQAHVFHYTNPETAITMRDFEITGWTTTGELTNYPQYGIILEGGTNIIENFRINRCRRGIWLKTGNYNKIKYGQIGFFDVYGMQLGHVDTGGAGAAVSETRLEELAIYSSASSISGGTLENAGTQLRLSSNCGATVITRCEGGSTNIGIEIIDGLGIGDATAPGFVTIVDYNAGKNRDAGLWVKNNGNNLRVINSRFSAEDSSSGDGIRIDSAICAAIFENVDCHWCARNGIRITNAFSVTILGGAFYEIGIAGGVNGRAIDVFGGTGKIEIRNCVFDPDLQVNQSRDMQNAIRTNSGFAGVMDVMGCTFKGIVSTNVVKNGGSINLHTYNVTVL
jgi:hypothetical protein